LQPLKIRFNEQMIEYYKDGKHYLEIAKCYWEIYQTVAEEDSLEYLKLLVIFLALSARTNEQSDFLNRVNALPNLEKIVEYRSLVTMLLTIEVIVWKLLFEKIEELFSIFPGLRKVFREKEEMDVFWNEFECRIIEHNIRVVEKYYKRITTKRLSALLSLNDKDTEKHLGRMVVSGSVYAKIDRPHGIVSFRKVQTPSALLNCWGNDIDSLLKIVENTCHLIERENMVHNIK